MRKKILSITGIAAGVVAVGLLAPSTAAFATNGSSCGNGTLSVIRVGNAQQCYANRGDLDVSIRDAKYVDTGSNSGYVNWTAFSAGRATNGKTNFGRNERKNFNLANTRITHIHIN